MLLHRTFCLMVVGAAGATSGCTAARTSAPPATPAVAATPAPPALARAAAPPRAPVDPAVACPADAAGPAPLRRLTRDQYIYTVVDLLKLGGAERVARDLRGVSQVANTTLPADENVGPFRSNVVAAPSRLDVEQLMESAERLADAAAPNHERALGCDLAAESADACGGRFVDEFGPRAFRRALRPAERERYARLFAAAAAGGGAQAGVRAVLRVILQSPYFLMHTREDDPSGAGAQSVRPLGPYALASRLSYMLWASMPDEALFRAAERGALATAEGLRSEARRMLADEKSRRGITAFHLQWLDVENVASVPKKKNVVPLWTKNMDKATTLGNALLRETERFVDHVIRRGDGKLDTLLTASYSFLDEPLFEYYGVPRPADYDPDRPVALNPRERAGLLTHGSVLAYHAHAAQSSPVARGVLVRKRVLCQELPDPPPNVNNTPPDPDDKLTTRERFEEHRLNGVCSGCHKLIDPLGFGFENYDAIGQFRAQDSGKPVDASGTIYKTASGDVRFVGAVELAQRLAATPEVRSCYVRQWFRYAVGRLETDADACSLRALEEHFEQTGHDVRELLVALPTTAAFRLRGAADADPPAKTTKTAAATPGPQHELTRGHSTSKP